MSNVLCWQGSCIELRSQCKGYDGKSSTIGQRCHVEVQMHLANDTNDVQVVCIVRGYQVGNLMIGFLLTSWKNTKNTLMCTVHEVQIEKEIKILVERFIRFFSMHQQKLKLLTTRICEVIRCT